MSTEMSSQTSVGQDTATSDLKLEVIVLPVADADRSKQFFASLGWREDADFPLAEGFRVLQFTPPGSEASIIFGTGVTDGVPGSVGATVLVVHDVDKARAELIERGVDVSEVFHGSAFSADVSRRLPGRDPEGNSYGSYASFTDPDGNEFVLQEIKTRLPGRVDTTPVAKLAELLLETALHHDAFEKATPEHNWWDWYAPYLAAREQGKTSEEATEAADSYMKDERGIVRQQ